MAYSSMFLSHFIFASFKIIAGQIIDRIYDVISETGIAVRSFILSFAFSPHSAHTAAAVASEGIGICGDISCCHGKLTACASNFTHIGMTVINAIGFHYPQQYQCSSDSNNCSCLLGEILGKGNA